MNTVSFNILHSFPASIAIIDSDGQIIFANKAWDDFAVKNSTDSAHTGIGVNYLNACKKITGEEVTNGQEAANGIRKVIHKEIPEFEMEYACHSPNEKRWFIMRCSLLDNNSGYCLISHVNVTKRKLAEENVELHNSKLQEINARLESTVFKIAHDIQAPLNSVEGLINLSKTGTSDIPAHDVLGLIEKRVADLKDFLRETVQLSAQANKIEPIEFKSIVLNYIESIKHASGSAKIFISTEVSHSTLFWSLKTDVNSIISNLISNSLKYSDSTKTSSTIEIRIDVNDSEAVICIRDNGIGIASDHTEKIFELNFRVTQESNTGSGLGLYMVKQSVKNLRGTIQVKSELNEGSEFIVRIPNLKINTLSS